MTVMTDHAAPPGHTDPADTAFLERLHALEATAAQKVADRDLAMFLAAAIARYARAVARDRDRLLAVNLALQAELDAGPVEAPRRGRRHRRQR